MKKLILVVILSFCAATPALAGRYGGGYSGRSSFSASHSYSSGTLSRSFNSYSRPTPSYSAPRTVTRNTTVVHEHYGSGGGLMGNPFFWMYMSDRNQPQQPVVVQQAPGAYGPPQGGYVAPPAQPSSGGPSFFGVLLVLVLLGGIAYIIVRANKVVA